jgi:hypothetical protein
MVQWWLMKISATPALLFDGSMIWSDQRGTVSPVWILANGRTTCAFRAPLCSGLGSMQSAANTCGSPTAAVSIGR